MPLPILTFRLNDKTDGLAVVGAVLSVMTQT